MTNSVSWPLKSEIFYSSIYMSPCLSVWCVQSNLLNQALILNHLSFNCYINTGKILKVPRMSEEFSFLLYINASTWKSFEKRYGELSMAFRYFLLRPGMVQGYANFSTDCTYIRSSSLWLRGNINFYVYSPVYFWSTSGAGDFRQLNYFSRGTSVVCVTYHVERTA